MLFFPRQPEQVMWAQMVIFSCSLQSGHIEPGLCRCGIIYNSAATDSNIWWETDTCCSTAPPSWARCFPCVPNINTVITDNTDWHYTPVLTPHLATFPITWITLCINKHLNRNFHWKYFFLVFLTGDMIFSLRNVCGGGGKWLDQSG